MQWNFKAWSHRHLGWIAYELRIKLFNVLKTSAIIVIHNLFSWPTCAHFRIYPHIHHFSVLKILSCTKFWLRMMFVLYQQYIRNIDVIHTQYIRCFLFVFSTTHLLLMLDTELYCYNFIRPFVEGFC